MKEEEIEAILKASPNAKRAKDGVILETEDGLFHITGIHVQENKEELGGENVFFTPFCTDDEIRRVLKPRSASDYLLQLQAEAIVDNPRLIRVFKNRKRKVKNWSLESFYANQQRDLSYLANLSKGKQKKLSQIPFGGAYLNCVNAKCIKTDPGNIVTISETLEYFFYFMNIWFYGETLSIPVEDQFAAFIIAMRLMKGYESFDFDLDPRCFLPPEIEKTILELTHSQYQFIIGHEYAHHLLGHLDKGFVVENNLSNFVHAYEGSKSIKHYKYTHKLEYDADWYAIKHITGNSEFREELANGAFSVFLYFDAYRIISDFITPSPKMDKGSHPSDEARIKKLRSRLNNKYGFSMKQIEEHLNYTRSFARFFIKDYLPFNFEEFEIHGSFYLPSFKGKILKDRIDF